MRMQRTILMGATVLAAVLAVPIGGVAHAQPKKPNILVIMGDDIG
jgi:hypothetical protein